MHGSICFRKLLGSKVVVKRATSVTEKHQPPPPPPDIVHDNFCTSLPILLLSCGCLQALPAAHHSHASLPSNDVRQTSKAWRADIGDWKSMLNLSLPICRYNPFVKVAPECTQTV